MDITTKDLIDEIIRFCNGYYFDKDTELEQIDYKKIENSTLRKIKDFRVKLKQQKKHLTNSQFAVAHIMLTEKENQFYANKITQDVLKTWSETELEDRNQELLNNNKELITTELSEYDFKMLILNGNQKYFSDENYKDLKDSLGIIHKKEYIK